MAIDIKVSVDARFFRRWMTVRQLKNILNLLKDDDAVFPNRVGNLTVLRDSELRMVGFIDFQAEIFEPVEEK